MDHGAPWAQILRGKYCRGGDLSTPILSRNCTNTWRGILETKELVQKGLRFSIGDGRKTKFWIDKWVDGATLLTHAIRAVPDEHRPLPIRNY